MEFITQSSTYLGYFIGGFLSIAYLLISICMGITAYMGGKRGPFGKHPHIIRFGFLPGIVGSELSIHFILINLIISVFFWKLSLFENYNIARVGMIIEVVSSFYLLKNYFSGLSSQKTCKKVLDQFCQQQQQSQQQQQQQQQIILNQSTTIKKSGIINGIKTFQKNVFRNIETFLMSFRKIKSNNSYSSSYLPEPTKLSISFWLKMLIPLPHPHFPNVNRIRHIPYGDDEYQKVDVYFHNTCPSSRPILVYIHGGGWREGGGKRHTCGMPLIYQMANQKWIVFSVGYRLAPVNRFPVHINDVKLAIQWIRENAVHYGGDMDSMFIVGGSAGGHLATLAALTDGRDIESIKPTLKIPKYNINSKKIVQEDEINQQQDNINNLNNNNNNQQQQQQKKKEYPPFRGCVSMYAVYDFTNRYKTWPFDLVTYLGQMIMRSTYEEEPQLYTNGSPIDHIHENIKLPFLLIHGDLDELVPIEESYHFMKKFNQVVKNPNLTYLEIPGAHHAYDLIYSPRTIYTVHAIFRYLNRLYRNHINEKLRIRKQQQLHIQHKNNLQHINQQQPQPNQLPLQQLQQNQFRKTIINNNNNIILLLITSDFCQAASKSDKLKIGVKFRPKECTRKTVPGDRLKIHYTGTLLNGDKFDSSVDRNDPFEFTLARGEVIKGWDQGLLGMCIGEKRKLTIPPSLGYGDRPAGKIPAGSHLVFETELIDIISN
eukprot:gene10754-13162_t